MRATRRQLVLCLGALLLSLAATSTAAAQTEMTGVRAMGLGDAFTGGPSGTGAIFYNPAGIATLMMYSVEGSYVYDQATGRNLVHASIVDGKSNPFLGGGLGYTFSVSPEDANMPDFTGHDFYGSLASPIVPGTLYFGLTGHYLSYDQMGDDLANGFTLDTGLLVTLGDFVSVGVTGRDLIAVENSGRERQVRTGLSYRSPMLHVGFDTIFDFASDGPDVSYASGFELLVAQIVPIRIGYHFDGGTDHHLLSGGLGWRSPVVGLDALFRQDLNENDNRMAGIALDLYL